MFFRRAAVAVALLATLVCAVTGVAEAKPKPKPPTPVSFLKLEPADQSPVTKNGVTVAVSYTGNTDPRFFFFFTDPLKKDFWGTPKQTRLNMFQGLVVLEVAVTNNTGHVLRTNGAAVSMMPSDGSEPIQPFTMMELVQAWAAQGVIGLDAIVKEQKIRVINLERDQILPGQTLKGLLPFRAKIEGIKGCTLGIVDLVTQTDAAGNPTERTNFDFNFTEGVVMVEQP